jgi:SM-20-related protein
MISLAKELRCGDDDALSFIASGIESNGYAILDRALPLALVDGLFLQLTTLPDAGLSRAGIGREADHQLNRFVRGDEICWLDRGAPAAGHFLDWAERLRLALNQRLFLGLFDYEAHFARYVPGAFYKRHLDAFEGFQRNRVLSTVLYLNPSWQPGDGGEMVMYAPGLNSSAIETVQPVYGRLVVFLSECFPHEVLPTRAARFSIAGWFRVNGTLGGQLDPAL